MHSPFGTTGLLLSRLGLGTASFAGVNMVDAPDYRPPSHQQVTDLILLAVGSTLDPQGRGRFMVDTSAQYGRSEQMLSAFLRAHSHIRDRLYIATKWGLLFDPEDFCRPDYSLENLHTSVARSAELLGRIDLLYLHSNPGVSPAAIRDFIDGRGGAFTTMCEWKRTRQYGIRHIGISISAGEHLSILLARPDRMAQLDVLQLNAPPLLEDRLSTCRLNRAGVALVLNSPYRKAPREFRVTRESRAAMYHRILSRYPGAVLLTGTSDRTHLAENIEHARSWHKADAPKLHYLDENGTRTLRSEAVEAELRHHFIHFFRPRQSRAAASRPAQTAQETASRLAKLIIGTRNTRLGPHPDQAKTLHIQRRIEHMVRAERPVEAILTWAPRKFYARRGDNRIDLCELSAIHSLLDLHVSATRFYSKGLHYTIFYEDFEGVYIERESTSSFALYRDGLESLMDVLCLHDVISVVRTSDWLEAQEDPDRVYRQLEDNSDAIANYWFESDRVGIEQSESLDSYHRMAALGFIGSIEPATRRHYLQRLDRLLGDRANAREKTEMVIRLFACVLLHRQFDTFAVEPRCNPVKLSFLQTAGGPGFITDGRVDIRTTPANVTKRSLAPWSAKGYLRTRGDRILPAMETWREVVQREEPLIPGRIVLHRGALSVCAGADMLPGP